MAHDKIVKIEGGTELINSDGAKLNLQPSKCSAVTITSELLYPRGILFVGTGGDIAVIPADNTNATTSTDYIVFKNIPDGTFFPVPIVRVGAVGKGTSATDLVFCT